MPFASYYNILMDHTGGAISSATTSPAFLVADLGQMALSIETRTTFASIITVQGTNREGFAATIPDAAWSNLTAITSPGVFTIDPGMRWLRVASASSVTVILSGRVRG